MILIQANITCIQPKIVEDWNSLTENIVTLESLDIFKCGLDKHWRTEWFKISTAQYLTKHYHFDFFIIILPFQASKDVYPLA